MRWIKPFEQLPRSEDFADASFTLNEMLEAYYTGLVRGWDYTDGLSAIEYFKTKFNINIYENTKL